MTPTRKLLLKKSSSAQRTKLKFCKRKGKEGRIPKPKVGRQRAALRDPAEETGYVSLPQKGPVASVINLPPFGSIDSPCSPVLGKLLPPLFGALPTARGGLFNHNHLPPSPWPCLPFSILSTSILLPPGHPRVTVQPSPSLSQPPYCCHCSPNPPNSAVSMARTGKWWHTVDAVAL